MFIAKCCSVSSTIHKKINNTLFLQGEEEEIIMDGLLAGMLAFHKAEAASEELKAFSSTKDA